MTRIIFFLVILFRFTVASAQMSDSVITKVTGEKKGWEKTYYYWLEDKRIPVKITELGTKKDIVMISLHNDETTSVEAAKNILSETGGVLVELNNEGDRLIHFIQDGKAFQFDPNRMFSMAGLQQNMRKLNRELTKSAISAAREFGKFVLRLIPKSPKITIAIHNNDDKNYSINDYKKGQSFAKETSGIHINKTRDADDFFLTTDRKIFNTLKSKGYNVILQNNAKATDDGSLSIYYGKRKKAYVNAEAEHGHLAEQVDMLRTLVDKR